MHVIGPNGSGSASHGSSSFTETCRSSLPASTSCIATIVANDFEIEPTWNRVSGRIGVADATSAIPRTATPISSRSVMASAPGGVRGGQMVLEARTDAVERFLEPRHPVASRRRRA